MCGSSSLLSRALIGGALVLACACGSSWAIPAGTGGQDPEVLPAGISPGGDLYGFSVAIAGPWMFCGAIGHDGAFDDQGRVDIYRINQGGWELIDPIEMPGADAGMGDNFGYSLDARDNVLIVGARLDDDTGGANQGSAWIFRDNGLSWLDPPAKLVASDANGTDLFGTSVGIFGDTAAVGAPLDDDDGGSSGSVYVFQYDGSVWTQTAKLTASDAAEGDQFGAAVDVYGDYIVVGSPRADTPDGADAGAVYVFQREGDAWIERKKIRASDGAGLDFFGASVAMDFDTIVAGAPSANAPVDAAGAVYVFKGSSTSWPEQAKLTASDAAGFEEFGSSVDLLLDTVVIGAFVDDDAESGSINSGAAFTFIRDGSTWTEDTKFLRDKPLNNEHFGRDVAVGVDMIAVGASGVTTGGGASGGEVRVWYRSNEMWIGDDQKRVNFGGSDWRQGAAVAIDGRIAAISAPGAISDEGVVMIYELSGARWTRFETQSLEASDAEVQDFGFDVAISGETVVVGAPGKNSDTGAVYVFVRSGGVWLEQQVLTSTLSLTGDRFGASVAIDGDTIVIGSPGDAIGTVLDQGSIYVFTRSGSTWTEQVKIFDSNPSEGALFGNSVDIHDGTIAAGAPFGIGSLSSDQGAVDVLTGSGASWTLQQRLGASDGEDNDEFGFSVGVDGDSVIVGAPGKTVTIVELMVDQPGAGAVYIYTRNAGVWSENAAFNDVGSNNNARYGHSVDVSGNRAIAGGPNVGSLGSEAGWVNLHYQMGGQWLNLSLIPFDQNPMVSVEAPPLAVFDEDPQIGDHFGTAVGISGDWCIVGAPDDDTVTPVVTTEIGSFSLLCVAEERWNTLVMNTTMGTFHAVLEDAIASATDGDDLLGTPHSFRQFPFQIGGLGKGYDVESTGGVMLMPGTKWVFGMESSLTTAEGRAAAIWGQLLSGAGAEFTLDTSHVYSAGDAMEFDGLVASTTVNTLLWGPFDSASETEVVGSIFSLVSFRGFRNHDRLLLIDSEFAASFYNLHGSVVESQGTNLINADIRNSGTILLNDTTFNVLGAIVNEGNGSISDGGTTRAGTPSNLYIGRWLFALPGSSISLANDGDVLRIGNSLNGTFDLRGDDNSLIDLTGAEVNMVGTGLKPVEVASTDIGNSMLGLDRTLSGHYPMRAFRAGDGMATTNVRLDDDYDNDGLGQGQNEAMYVCDLIIEANASIITSGRKIYYKTLVNNGSVDNPSNLIKICVADLDNSGTVDGADLAILLAAWGGGISPADLNGDGNVDGADLAVLLASWGAC